MVEKLAAFAVPPAGSFTGLAGANKAGGTQPTGQSFASLIDQFQDDSMKVAKNSEKMAFEAVAKKADVVDVVTAVANAELTLQTVMNIRDRVMSAYQEIIKTPI